MDTELLGYYLFFAGIMLACPSVRDALNITRVIYTFISLQYFTQTMKLVEKLFLDWPSGCDHRVHPLLTSLNT